MWRYASALTVALLVSVPAVAGAQSGPTRATVRAAVFAADSAAVTLAQLASSQGADDLLRAVRLAVRSATLFDASGATLSKPQASLRDDMAGVSDDIAPRLLRELMSNEGQFVGNEASGLATYAAIIHSQSGKLLK
ncbi:MAG: hypothetical protein ACR2M1_11275 [Gemmatimonadaceae bacterium]